jgi:choline dehydrogenase
VSSPSKLPTNRGDIVVGGGTAGLAIASRLAESARVAVIEAGGFYETDNGNQSVVPFYGLIMPVLASTEVYPRQPLIDWDLVTVPQSGAGGRKIHYAQGKTLGGSSALNTMAYLRASRGSYQRWADVVGDDGYKFDRLFPFFKKSCHLTAPNFRKRATPNATFEADLNVCDDGPIEVSWANFVDPTQTWLAKALQAIGMPLSRVGFNTGVLSGFGAWITTTISPERAFRSTSESGYLREAIPRTEIIVYPHTQATKILFSAGKAIGVSVSTQGLEYALLATKEVIVSAGAFHSPQLLMVSGSLASPPGFLAAQLTRSQVSARKRRSKLAGFQ